VIGVDAKIFFKYFYLNWKKRGLSIVVGIHGITIDGDMIGCRIN